MKKSDQAILLVHELEDQYGSILNVPEKNPILVKLHQLFNVEEKSHLYTRDLSKKQLTKTQIHEITLHIRQGYPLTTTERLFHISPGVYLNIKQMYGLADIPVFRYVAKSANGKTYFASMHDVNKVLGVKVTNPFRNTQEIAADRGIKLEKKWIIWKNIHNGDHYATSDGSLHTKNGLNSFFHSKT